MQFNRRSMAVSLKCELIQSSIDLHWTMVLSDKKWWYAISRMAALNVNDQASRETMIIKQYWPQTGINNSKVLIYPTECIVLTYMIMTFFFYKNIIVKEQTWTWLSTIYIFNNVILNLYKVKVLLIIPIVSLSRQYIWLLLYVQKRFDFSSFSIWKPSVYPLHWFNKQQIEIRLSFQ